MSRPDDADSDAIETQAAEWLVRRDEGLSREGADDLARWLADDPRHAEAWQRLEATWAILEKMPQQQPAVAEREQKKNTAVPRGVVVPFRAATLWTAIAATVVLGLAVNAWRPHEREPDPGVRYTATNAQQRVTLPDGSRVELNAGSELRVRFSAGRRDVALSSGEGHFIVVENPARPFVVSARGVSVRAVGTAFAVRLAPAAVEVLVTQGRVSVTETPEGGMAQTTVPELAAGQRAVVGSGKAPVVQTVSDEAIREALAWEPPLTFNETPLATVIEEFNRRNRVQLSLADAALGARPVGGTFRADNVHAFVRLLEKQDILVERPEPNRIVLRSPR
jgi:transmembrane sensor